MLLIARFRIRLKHIYLIFQVTYVSLHALQTYLCNHTSQTASQSPVCSCCRLYLLHPVWSCSSVTALVKHTHTSTWHVPSTCQSAKCKLIDVKPQTSDCRQDQPLHFHPELMVIFLNMTQSPSAPFLKTLGLLSGDGSRVISEQDVKGNVFNDTETTVSCLSLSLSLALWWLIMQVYYIRWNSLVYV